jgi:hypothetical protein
MGEIDTSTAAVEAEANLFTSLGSDDTAALLRALGAERDAERQRADAAEALLKTCEAANESLQDRILIAEAEVARLRAQVACSECQQPMDMCSRCEIAEVCKNAGCSCFDAGCESETQARATEAQGGVK